MAETLASIKRSISLQHHLAEEVESLRAETRERAALSNRQRLKSILEPSVYPDDRYTTLNNSRTRGTGDWLVEDPAFKAWVAGDYPFIWICGNPGESHASFKLFSNLPSALTLYQARGNRTSRPR